MKYKHFGIGKIVKFSIFLSHGQITYVLSPHQLWLKNRTSCVLIALGSASLGEGKLWIQTGLGRVGLRHIILPKKHRFYCGCGICGAPTSLMGHGIRDRHILANAKAGGWFHYHSRKYLNPCDILYLLNSQMRPRIRWCYTVRAGAAQSSLSSLDRIQKSLRSLPRRWIILHLQHKDETLLRYPYHYGRCSKVWHSSVPPDLTFRSRHVMFTVENCSRVLSVPLMKSKFYSNSFFPRTNFVEQIPERMLP